MGAMDRCCGGFCCAPCHCGEDTGPLSGRSARYLMPVKSPLAPRFSLPFYTWTTLPEFTLEHGTKKTLDCDICPLSDMYNRGPLALRNFCALGLCCAIHRA